MARQTSVSFVDDLDGSKAVETVKFGLDGKTYEIDLNKKNAAALRKAVAAYVDNGRRIRSTASSSKRSSRTATRSSGLRRHPGMGHRQRHHRQRPRPHLQPASASNTKPRVAEDSHQARAPNGASDPSRSGISDRASYWSIPANSACCAL